MHALYGAADAQEKTPAEDFLPPGSGCKKSLAEFALASAKKIGAIFSGGVYVGENTYQPANV